MWQRTLNLVVIALLITTSIFVIGTPARTALAAQVDAIPIGTFTVQSQTAIIVREVDFRGSPSPAQDFIHVQFLEAGQSMTFGQNAVTQGVNRDGWVVQGSIEEANIEALALAVKDASGGIPGADIWFQLECLSSQLDISRRSGFEIKQLGENNFFIRVTRFGHDPLITQVCAPGQAPAPTTPTPPATTSPQCSANTVLAFPADSDVFVPAGWSVIEIVDNLSMMITIQVRNLAANELKAEIIGMTHVNVWSCYGSQQAAERGARSQVKERQREAAIPHSWNEGYFVDP